ncbi:MAG: Hsp20/alpha crystallin family protein [Thermoplasmatota archaeon]
MSLRKEKKNKIIERPTDKTQITNRGPSDLWSDFDQLFDSFRSSFDDLFWPFSHQRSLIPYTQQRIPPMNLADLGDHYEMKVEMPGISKEDINIEVTPTGIEIKAEQCQTTENQGQNWLRKECSTQSFYRSFELPEELKTDTVEAELKDGILTINLPKVKPTTEKKAKKVSVK